MTYQCPRCCDDEHHEVRYIAGQRGVIDTTIVVADPGVLMPHDGQLATFHTECAVWLRHDRAESIHNEGTPR